MLLHVHLSLLFDKTDINVSMCMAEIEINVSLCVAGMWSGASDARSSNLQNL